MTALKRNFILALCFIAPFLCLTLLALHYQREEIQQRRDHDLRQAIKSDNLRGVVLALQQGADPNCRETARDGRSLWQRARQWFRPVAYHGDPLRSALTIAVGRDVGDPLETDSRRFAILKALHDAGAIAEGDAPEFRAALAALPPAGGPTANAIPASWTQNTQGARDGLQTFLREKGMSAQAFRQLGRVFLQSDYYDAAERCFEIALLWQTNDPQSRVGLAQTQDANRVVEEVTRLRTDKRAAIAARLYAEEPGRRVWVTLCARETYYRFDESFARLGLYAEQGGAFRLLSESNVFYNGESALAVAPVTGKAAPEIVLATWINPGDSGETTLEIFAVPSGHLRRIFKLDSSGEIYLESLRRDRRYEAVSEDSCMDYHSQDKPAPWRKTTYAYNGKTFVLSRRARIEKPCEEP